MYSSLLSVLLFGLMPQVHVALDSGQTIQALAVAPPAPPVVIQEALSASGVAILDLESGQMVYGKQEDVKRPMASLTKLMTALVIVEHHDLQEIVTIPDDVEETIGNKVYLEPGDTFTVGQLLSALLISSANDAADTLALFHSGSQAAFVAEMNHRAQQLGLQSTSYANPTGIDHKDQYATPRDIAWLMAHVLNQPAIAERMKQRSDKIASMQGNEITLYHTHALMHTSSPVIAGKTGTTDAAQQCLVSLTEQDGRTYIVVLFHSGERYVDMNKIIANLVTPLA